MMSKGCCLSGTMSVSGGTHKPGLGPVPGWLKQIVRYHGSGGTCNSKEQGTSRGFPDQCGGREGR